MICVVHLKKFGAGKARVQVFRNFSEAKYSPPRTTAAASLCASVGEILFARNFDGFPSSENHEKVVPAAS